MEIADDCRYTEEHEWARLEGESVRVGITDYAQQELGDVVFIDLPEVGAVFKKGETLANVESVKAVSDVYAPLDLEITAVNEALRNSPELINKSPMKEGWLVLASPAVTSQMKELMDAGRYSDYLGKVAK